MNDYDNEITSMTVLSDIAIDIRKFGIIVERKFNLSDRRKEEQTRAYLRCLLSNRNSINISIEKENIKVGDHHRFPLVDPDSIDKAIRCVKTLRMNEFAEVERSLRKFP